MIVRLAIAAAVLTAATPTLARKEPAEAPKVMPNGDAIICKKTVETGSMMRSTKRCYTRAQWNLIADAARANGQRMQSDHATGLVTN